MLLGLATIKVFLVDLSGLDVAYRVVSLIALGVLLLVGAGLWQRAQPGKDSADPERSARPPPTITPPGAEPGARLAHSPHAPRGIPPQA